jgi:predicted GTPase
MLRLWKACVLAVLLVAPIVAFVVLGFLWLQERTGPFGINPAWYASSLWIAAGVVFAILARRWTRAQRNQLLPLDWDTPQTFTPLDRAAWDLVQKESEAAETLPANRLIDIDTYIDTGRRLSQRLAAHYQPLSTDPFEHVPIIDMLTAMQLAAEDLAEMCRQVPGGDMITPGHWKKAVQAAGWLQRANELYTLLLPIFQPVAGLTRLTAQKLMVAPAWKGMQENLFRWFYRAFVNRLGTHLIELYSGRLAIGATMYRRLTRKAARGVTVGTDEGGPLRIAVAGRRDVGKSALIEALDAACHGDLSVVRARLQEAGFDAALADRLKTAEFVEVPGYTGSPGRESARDRQTRREAVAAATDADLLLLVVDARSDEFTADARFVEAWQEWFATRPDHEQPPGLAVVNHADELPEAAGGWEPPYDWLVGRRALEAAVRLRVERLRAVLPAVISTVVPVGLRPGTPFGVAERLLPDLAALLHRAERVALLRHLHSVAAASKAGRLFRQVGQQGRKLWDSVRSRGRHTAAGA